MMEKESRRARVLLAHNPRERLGGEGSDLLADPRLTKIPPSVLHRMLLQRMGRVWEQEPRQRKHPTRVNR